MSSDDIGLADAEFHEGVSPSRLRFSISPINHYGYDSIQRIGFPKGLALGLPDP